LKNQTRVEESNLYQICRLDNQIRESNHFRESMNQIRESNKGQRIIRVRESD